MAVSHSAASESHTGTTGSTNQASFSWTHAQTGTPQGVLVFVHTISASDFISSVTYGGVALDRIAGAVAIDTAGEPGRTDLFFLGSGLGTGNQTITVNRTNNATIMYASAATVLAATDTFVTGLLIEEQNQSLTVENIDDGSVSGTDSVRYCATYTGLAAPPAAGTGSTLLTSIDLGAYGAAMVRETTAGQGSRPVGFSSGSDDVAAVYTAVREAAAYILTADVSNFTLVGIDADLIYTAVTLFTAEAGAFTATGIDATLLHAARLTAEKGTYTANGIAATLSHAALIAAAKGTFTETGNPADLRHTAILVAEKGTYTFTGNNADLHYVQSIDINGYVGQFLVSGNAATLRKAWKLVAATRAINANGISSNIVYSGNVIRDEHHYYQIQETDPRKLVMEDYPNNGQFVYYVNHYLRIL